MVKVEGEIELGTGRERECWWVGVWGVGRSQEGGGGRGGRGSWGEVCGLKPEQPWALLPSRHQELPLAQLCAAWQPAACFEWRASAKQFWMFSMSWCFPMCPFGTGRPKQGRLALFKTWQLFGRHFRSGVKHTDRNCESRSNRNRNSNRAFSGKAPKSFCRVSVNAKVRSY